ncbi:MalY/PatB family protein [Microbacterium sp. ZW T5_45]|uniref:MalY/PatB family protein n=1 Tax=Microbacterium sp. ZW T5_45 TaxID=3378080 RepID=UPI003853AAF6
MSSGHEYDSITVEQLRASGRYKWTTYPDAIGAFIAEMDFGLAPEIAEVFTPPLDLLMGYPTPAIVDAMAEACARWQRDAYGWDVPATSIRPVGDVLIAMRAAIDHFSAPGSKIILPTPAYMPFLKIPPMHDREIVEVPMLVEDGRYVFDMEGLDRAFADGGGMLILCNPHNPTGRVHTREELLAVSEIVERHGGRVFSDEIHAPLVFAPHRHVPYASISAVTAAHTVTATSASKAWNLPGLKAAQVILTNEADAAVWATPVVTRNELLASNPGIIANTAAYDRARDWLADTHAYLERNRALLKRLLDELIPGIGYEPGEGTYIAWLDARPLGIEESPADFFREHAGVALTDGTACGAVGEGFLRFILATPAPIIEQAVRRMADALARR